MKQLQLNFEPQSSAKPLQLLTVAEIYDRIDQGLLQQLREDRRLERKPAGVHARHLGEYFAMYANTHPDGGLIVVGISDAGAFEGCNSQGQKRLNDLELSGEIYCPGAHYDTKRIPIKRSADGVDDFLLVMRVHYRQGRLVRDTQGNAYIRIGATKHRLSSEEERELAIDKGEISIEQESCALSYPDDFNMTAVRQFATAVCEKLDLLDRSEADVLASRHLGTLNPDGSFVPNVACALLFASEPDKLFPGAKIRFLRFDGTVEGTGEKFNAIKDQWIEGLGVPEIIAAAERIIDSQMRTFSHLEEDGKFYTVAEYPKVAWYEAIVNACVHRSYGNGLKNMAIFVKMFDDRLEIESPGPFPPFVTPENIYQMPHPRNPTLMHAMYFLNFVKMAAEGTRRMRDTMLRMDLPEPEFSQKEIGFAKVRVTLRNNIKVRKVWVDTDVSEIIGEAIASSLSSHEKQAINFVAENGHINVSQVVRLTGLGWVGAKKLLLRLTDQGILLHVRRKDIERDPNAHFILRALETESSSGL